MKPSSRKISRVSQRDVARRRNSPSTLSRGTMVSDVCLAVVWAATIPGLMWLGAAGGF